MLSFLLSLTLGVIMHYYYRDCLNLFWKSRFQKRTMNHTNTEQPLAPRLCRSGWDSTFDLFKPFYSASSPSDNTQIQLGHNKFMQPWKPSRDALNGANWTQHLMCFQQQIVVWLKVGKKNKKTPNNTCFCSQSESPHGCFFLVEYSSRILGFFFALKDK